MIEDSVACLLDANEKLFKRIQALEAEIRVLKEKLKTLEAKKK